MTWVFFSSASFAQAISSWKVWHFESSISKRATFLQKVRGTSISSVRSSGYCLITPKASAVVPFVFMSPSHLRNEGKYGRPEQTEINLGIEIKRWGVLRKYKWSSNFCELLACSCGTVDTVYRFWHGLVQNAATQRCQTPTCRWCRKLLVDVSEAIACPELFASIRSELCL